MLIIVGVLAFVPDQHQSAVVRVHRVRQQHRLAVEPFYVALLGLLLAQYTLTGFDASAHMTEETHDAARSRPARHRDVDRGLGRSPAGSC